MNGEEHQVEVAGARLAKLKLATSLQSAKVGEVIPVDNEGRVMDRAAQRRAKARGLGLSVVKGTAIGVPVGLATSFIRWSRSSPGGWWLATSSGRRTR